MQLSKLNCSFEGHGEQTCSDMLNSSPHVWHLLMCGRQKKKRPKGSFSSELSVCQMINRVQSFVEASGRIQSVGWGGGGEEGGGLPLKSCVLV